MSTIQELEDGILAIREEYHQKRKNIVDKDAEIIAFKNQTFLSKLAAYRESVALIKSQMSALITACETGTINSEITAQKVLLQTLLDNTFVSYKSTLIQYENFLLQVISNDFFDLKYYGLPTMAEMIADNRAVLITDEILYDAWNEYADIPLVPIDDYVFTNPITMTPRFIFVDEPKYTLPRNVFEEFYRRNLSNRTLYRYSTLEEGLEFRCIRFALAFYCEKNLSPYHQLWCPYISNGVHAFNITKFTDDPMLYIIEPQSDAGYSIFPVTQFWKTGRDDMLMYIKAQISAD